MSGEVHDPGKGAGGPGENGFDAGGNDLLLGLVEIEHFLARTASQGLGEGSPCRVDLARRGLDWVTFAEQVTESIGRVVPFDRCCWHTVDPGTVLFTGSLTRGITCSGSWLAQYEYVVEDVNKWWFLARSGRRAGATSIATHGDLDRSARHRSSASYGIGDELRASFSVDGAYWAAAGLLRDADQPWFTEDDVRFRVWPPWEPRPMT